MMYNAVIPFWSGCDGRDRLTQKARESVWSLLQVASRASIYQMEEGRDTLTRLTTDDDTTIGLDRCWLPQ